MGNLDKLASPVLLQTEKPLQMNIMWTQTEGLLRIGDSNVIIGERLLQIGDSNVNMSWETSTNWGLQRKQIHMSLPIFFELLWVVAINTFDLIYLLKIFIFIIYTGI